MKTLRYIAVLSLALYGFWGSTSRAAGKTPVASEARTTVYDTTEPSIPNEILFSDTARPSDAVAGVLADSSEDETDPPTGTGHVSPLQNIEDNNPAGDLYDDFDTLSVHAEKFDALAFNDTLRIPLNDPGHCQYVHPFNGSTTSGFGFRSYRYHFGVDINLETGDTVRCAFDGKVRIAQRSKTYGYVVVVRHNNGLETYYAHLSKLLVKPNEEIEAGMVLGLGGNTGHSFGSHLHFEVRFRGQPIDPNYLIDFKNQTLRTDTYNLTKSDFKYLTESYKVRHYSRKKKKAYYTYYCPGGAHYATPQARAIMASVPEPVMLNNSSSCKAPAHVETFKEMPAAASAAPKNTPAQKKPAAAPVKTTPSKTAVAKTPAKTGSAKAPVKTANAGATYYTVKSGDSLYAIALRNHTTVDKICALNGIKANGTLSIGKKLRVR